MASVDLMSATCCVAGAQPVKPDSKAQPYKDWVFINYTFKRFEGLTQRGVPSARDVVKHH
jgi:hypothetical protein